MRTSTVARLSRTGLSLSISTLLMSGTALAQSASNDASGGISSSAAATSAPKQLDQVVVRGEYIPEPMLQTSEVASFVTREDMERTGDSSAAVALTRVTGLSLSRGKYVYVRGLGERYSSALFNGSPLPSPEPMQRVVPLDLFPSDVLASVTVQKTYSADYPGEFGGGVIDLQSMTVPEKPFFSLTLGGGANSVSTGEKGLTYYGSGDDEWGVDDGTRKQPGALRDAIASGRRVDLGNFSREDIRRIGRSMNNANLYVLQERDSIAPDVNVGGSAGYGLEIGEAKLGILAVASYDNEWRTRTGKQQDGIFVGDSVEFNSNYDFATTRNNVRTNGMLGLGWEYGRHKIGWTTLYVHDALKVARSRAGRDELAGFDVRDDNTEWYERQLINNQLLGSHAFGEYDDLKVEWRAAVANASRDVPYETGIRYELLDGYWAHDASRVQNYTRFSKVDDTVASGGVDVTWRLPMERDLTVKGGLAYLDNDRTAWSREFRFLALDGPLPFLNQYQRVDYLLSDYNLSNDLLRLRETTGSFGAAAYDATLKVKAAYLQMEGEIVPTLRATVGVRYEDATQAVHPYDIFSGTRQDSVAPLENSYALPSATVTWNFADNQQLRFGASKTIARPQFREMAPQQYLDPDIDRQFFGNPFLVDSELVNLDARYEWFFEPGQYVTVGAFYKDIDKPIEAIVNDAPGGGIVQSFINAPKATLYGVELEAKKYLDLPIAADWWGDKRLFVSGNYTRAKSEVSASASDTVQPFGFSAPVQANLFIRDGSALQGQSDDIANLQIGVESQSTNSQATLIANYVGERISARGRPGQPDYVDKPGTSLDLVIRKGLVWSGDTLSVNFAARNLLKTRYQEFQKVGSNRVDLYSYQPGISYDISVTARF
ncbi:TonB-dependent receptor domain-containing protein [Xanthomonas melonis]|uniref:TonB-dependent receptor domain-containing protein n=1 Tax=Xanthomonas melonis TaxID=56456 RepID=UPI001E64EDB2|nr:TonB-dependent receptor [Xanthomonas melonis]MCD0247361.1 TonB-dependent receptor [Xanthomonas melonis]